MATLTVWKFPTALGAEQAEHTLEQLSKQELIKVQDAAIVSPRGREEAQDEAAQQPDRRRRHGRGLLGPAVRPHLLRAAARHGRGRRHRCAGRIMTDVGIDDDFIRSVREEITPGTSALFLMSSDAVMDKVLDAFEGQSMELVQTNLSDQQEAACGRSSAESRAGSAHPRRGTSESRSPRSTRRRSTRDRLTMDGTVQSRRQVGRRDRRERHVPFGCRRRQRRGAPRPQPRSRDRDV